ncbi:hypothetical protein [Hymenobacter cellulosilyticus]|uniref:Uncharacterized protein n=1 Tax=Hymenobacter cellulosilyticus TaxID=2932248 RepID=A0A8T9Q6U4_9BACT|nr:hypothetical protein [Hymenobacter cellulosilyticus]UOQ71199.1 hypothetical protein MUN79_21480 [Hymenobacter cellulosilyticus]
MKGTYKGTGSHRLDVTVHIENGKSDEPQPELYHTPSYSYEVKDAAQPQNSYRRFLEMQQQQQQ